MRSNGPSTNVLSKLAATGSSGGGRSDSEPRLQREVQLVGSEVECKCLDVDAKQSGRKGPGLECAAGLFGSGGDGRTVTMGDFGVGGHNGLLGSNIGADISLLSMEGGREELEEYEDEYLRQVCYGVGGMLPEVNAVHGRQVACGEGEGGRGRGCSFTFTPPRCGAWTGSTTRRDYNKR
jgi:hypothetical protein